MTKHADPRYEVTWLIRRLFRELASLADTYLADSGLTAADRAVLEFLYPDRQRTVPEIAALYKVTRQHVQSTINGLKTGGLVAAHANPRHKRSPNFALTDLGRETFAEIRRNEGELVDRLFDGLAGDDILLTRDTLATLRRRIESWSSE